VKRTIRVTIRHQPVSSVLRRPPPHQTTGTDGATPRKQLTTLIDLRTSRFYFHICEVRCKSAHHTNNNKGVYYYLVFISPSLLLLVIIVRQSVYSRSVIKEMRIQLKFKTNAVYLTDLNNWFILLF